MLDLCDDFGVEDSRGMLLTISFSHKDIASIVGASRPRVTEHLDQMERDRLLSRQGRQFIISAGKLSSSLAAQGGLIGRTCAAVGPLSFRARPVSAGAVWCWRPARQ
jgi:hypothetical protein